MELQVLLGLPVACAAFVLALATVRCDDPAKRGLRLARMRRVLLAYGAAALGLALLHWWHHRDWVHLLWTSVHPQVFLFLGAGAFLADEAAQPRAKGARLGRSPWTFGAALLAFALLPAVLVQWIPRANVGPRNVGRPIAGTIEVAGLGLCGPIPEVLEPENQAGVERGLGFLPREITVPVGGLAAGAILWIATCLVQLAGALVRAPRARLGVFLFAPFGAMPMLFMRPMPYGLVETTLWGSDPALLRAFGPLLVAAVGASALVPLGQRLATRGLANEVTSG